MWHDIYDIILSDNIISNLNSPSFCFSLLGTQVLYSFWNIEMSRITKNGLICTRSQWTQIQPDKDLLKKG